MKFEEIEKAYDELEKEMKNYKGLVFDTKKGIFGAVRCKRVFEFFKKIKLERYKKFIDLGCGDGRVVLIASLFTDATGIEIDEELVEYANKIKEKLNLNCEIRCSDYLEEDLSQYDFLFINPDQGFHKALEQKLLKEMKGVLFVNNDIFLPEKLKKGKSQWFDDIPIIEYSI